MSDTAGTTLDHLMSLTPEEAVEVVKKLSPEQKRELAMGLCRAVNDMAKHVVSNADAIWEEGQQRKKELH